MSSSEGYEPSNASSDNFQPAQLPQEKADGSPLSSDGLLSDASLNRGASSPADEAFDDDRDGDGEANPEAAAVAAADPTASQEVDGSSSLSPEYLHPNGALFKDNISKSLWRNRTAGERQTFTSLGQLRAKDLSIHLYNAAQLKSRVRSDREAPAHDSNGFVETREPPNSWTAWPLPPRLVPREHERKQWEERASLQPPYSTKQGRPGAELRDLLVAQVLRTARRTFDARQWEGPTADSISRHSSDSPQNPLRGPQISDGGDVKPGLTASGGIGDLMTVILADDEIASKILRPIMQHLMTKLDGLLMGLHHARSSYLSVGNNAKQKTTKKRKRSSSKREERSQKQRKSSTVDDGTSMSDSSSGSELVDSGTEDSRPASKRNARASAVKDGQERFARRRRRLGLRDWSDVLGVASMTGVDAHVVGRAAFRCAALFDEGISFRTMHEGGNEDTESTYLPPGRGSSKLNARLEIEHDQEADIYGGVHVDGFMQPIQGKKSWKYPKASRRKGSSGEDSGSQKWC